MQALREALHGLQQLFATHAQSRRAKALRSALKREARSLAEVHYQDHLANFYEQAAARVDPHQDWNTFAELKNQWHEHQLEREREMTKLVQASARVSVLQQSGDNGAPLQETPHERPATRHQPRPTQRRLAPATV